MRLKNKKTGEIRELPRDYMEMPGGPLYYSLAELNEDWEDYKEPKAHYSITQFGDVVDEVDGYMSETIDEMKKIGNYFNTREEAEQAVEKLKAWKRLKDKGITFEAKVIDRKWYIAPKANPSQRTFDEAYDIHKDLMIIFGGEDGE